MTVTAEQAKAMLDAATPGIWEHGVAPGDKVDYLVGAVTGVDPDLHVVYQQVEPDRHIVMAITGDGPTSNANAALIAAAPDLAATVVELYERLATVAAKRIALARWKAEAMTVLAGWNQVWEDAGRPGVLGDSISAATATHVTALEARCVAAERDAREWERVAVERTDQRDALQAAIDKALALHESVGLMGVNGERTGIYTCAECGDEDVAWPCDTVQALTQGGEGS